MGVVGGHDDERVLEVDGASLAVRQTAVVQYLQEGVEHIGMSLLYLVEEHHAVGLASHGLGELSALVITHISRRCTDEARNGELLLILAHVYACHHLLVVEEVFRQGTCQFRFAHTCGAQEDERPDGALGIL